MKYYHNTSHVFVEDENNVLYRLGDNFEWHYDSSHYTRLPDTISIIIDDINSKLEIVGSFVVLDTMTAVTGSTGSTGIRGILSTYTANNIGITNIPSILQAPIGTANITGHNTTPCLNIVIHSTTKEPGRFTNCKPLIIISIDSEFITIQSSVIQNDQSIPIIAYDKFIESLDSIVMDLI